MRKNANTPSALAKVEIQELLRQVGLKWQNGTCFFLGKKIGGKVHSRCTSKETKDGHIVMQYDHLNPRERNVSYANPLLGLVICQGLHGWKSFNDSNKKLYDDAARKYISVERRKLWKKVEEDHKSYLMTLWDWEKEIISLKAELQS